MALPVLSAGGRKEVRKSSVLNTSHILVQILPMDAEIKSEVRMQRNGSVPDLTYKGWEC